MPGGSAPKRKGTRIERDIVNLARARDLEAVRSWGSDGRSQGYSEETDIVIEGLRHQVKGRRELPRVLHIPDTVDVMVYHEDHHGAVVLITLDQYLEFLSIARQYKGGKSGTTHSKA